MITGAHVVLFTSEPDAARAFLRDKLAFDSVDAGHNWLIFALPPAELGVHPTEDAGRHELYLMCDDIEATVRDLGSKGVEFVGDIEQARFGRIATMRIPGGELRVYEPAHASPPVGQR